MDASNGSIVFWMKTFFNFPAASYSQGRSQGRVPGVLEPPFLKRNKRKAF